MSQDLLMAPVRAWGACGVCLIHATRPRCTMTLALAPSRSGSTGGSTRSRWPPP